MIFPAGLTQTAAALAVTLASTGTCPLQNPARLHTAFDNTPHILDHSRTTAELGGMKSDTVFSKHRNEVFITGGITSSTLAPQYKLSFRISTTPMGERCLYIDKAELIVSYKPIVYIARDYPQGSCLYGETWQHELKHVNTDISTIQEFMPRFADQAQRAINGIAADPLIAGTNEQAQNAAAAKVQKAVENVLGQLTRLREQRQQLIDTRQEYMRMSKACPEQTTRPR